MDVSELSRSWADIPPVVVFLSAFVSSIIPLTIYKVNRWLHAKGDPPWKEKQDDGGWR